mgnify:CR=1 FL=1
MGSAEEGEVGVAGKHAAVVVVGVDEGNEEAMGEQLSGEVHHGVDVALCRVREEQGMRLDGSSSGLMAMAMAMAWRAGSGAVHGSAFGRVQNKRERLCLLRNRRGCI